MFAAPTLNFPGGVAVGARQCDSAEKERAAGGPDVQDEAAPEGEAVVPVALVKLSVPPLRVVMPTPPLLICVT